MALTYPLSLAQFMDLLPKVEATLDPGEAMLANRTAGGEIITSQHGARLWGGRLTVRGHAYVDLDSLVARAELLRQPGASFFVTQTVRSGPQADPDGAILGAATPTITTVASNNRDVTISGLPASYPLRRGDLLSFTYLSSPTRYALHRIMSNVNANGSGVAANVELSPPVRPGYSTPMAVTLVNPVCKALIVPGSYQPPVVTRPGRATFSLDWIQTLR